MGPCPQVILADRLATGWPSTELKAASTESIRCFWALARPMSMGGLGQRIRLAWGVFTGRYDALQWVQQ